MIRNFNAQDIPSFPNIKIVSYAKDRKDSKDYLLIERKPFVTCFVTINDTYGIFVKQYRPIIGKTTLEIPMGKIEDFDSSPSGGMKRELQEEINLFTEEKYILVKNPHTYSTREIFFDKIAIIAESPNYLSPGFPTSQQYPFMVRLHINDFEEKLGEDVLFSEEEDLEVVFLPLESQLTEELDGLSKYYMIMFLYDLLRNKK